MNKLAEIKPAYAHLFATTAFTLLHSCQMDCSISLCLCISCPCALLTGQEAAQAFEDAADLGAAVMMCGPTREALRKFELRRRPRWKHVMQVSHLAPGWLLTMAM